MDERQIDIKLSSVQRMRKEWQTYILKAFLLGKKYGETKPIDVYRLGQIMGEFSKLEEKVGWV